MPSEPAKYEHEPQHREVWKTAAKLWAIHDGQLITAIINK